MNQAEYLSIHFSLLAVIFTFTISIVWGIVKKLIFYIDLTSDDNVDDVISSYFGRKLSKKILLCIFIPFTVLSGVLIFIIPIFFYYNKTPLVLDFILSLILFVFTAISLEIYKIIYRKSKKETNKEVSNYSKLKLIRGEDEMLLFLDSVFRKTDDSLESKYGIKGILLMSTFLEEIDHSIEKDLDKTIDYYNKAINIFLSNIDKRNTIALFITTDIVDKILNVHFKIWSLAYSELISGNVNRHRWIKLDMLSETLSSLIMELVDLSLQSGEVYSYMKKMGDYFREKANIKFEKGSRQYWYLEQFSFEKILFKNVEKFSNRDFGVNIPKDWLLTIENVSKRKHSEMKVIDFIIHEYLHWADAILHYQSKEKELFEKFNEEWIPNISPKAWSYIITYKRRSWSDDNRIKSFIENPPDFNQRERVHIYSRGGKNGKDENKVFWNELSKDIEEDWYKAIKLAQHIRTLGFSREEVNKCLQQILNISVENEEKEKVLTHLKFLFEGVLKELTNSK